MRILIICRELPPVGGGAGYVALNLATRLSARDHHVDLVTMHYGALPESESIHGVHVHRLRVGRRREDSSRILEMARFVAAGRRRVRALARQEAYDVAHAHAIVPDGLLLGSLPQDTVTVVTAHGSDVPGYNPDKFRTSHRLMGPLWRRAVRRPAVLTTPSEHLRSLIRKAGVNRRIVAVPNGIDTTLFTPREKTRELLVVARLVRRKNVHLVLEALQELQQPVTLHIVGDGPERQRLMMQASGLDSQTVRFHGWLEHGSAAWRDLYERCRFFLFPSSSENFPINLLEAQLARMVVVASDIPGNREVLGDTASYAASLDARGILTTLRTILDLSDEELDRRGQLAEQRVIDHFSWDRVADTMADIYDDYLVRR